MGGVPCWGVPYLGPPGRVPPSWPQGVTPILTWQGTPPRCLPHGILGNVAKHYGIWVPPQCLPHGILGNVAKHYGIWVPPGICPMAFWEMLQSIMGYGYPPMWTDRLMDGRTDVCQNITSSVILRTRAVTTIYVIEDRCLFHTATQTCVE